MSPNNFDLQLVELQRRSVGRLISAEVFDEAAFHELKSYLCEKAELLKSEYVVSKQIVACLLEAVAVIDSRAVYVEDAKRNAHLSDEFFMLLGLIASGEGCNDRKPGVPRVR
jgi:hypothetical protein